MKIRKQMKISINSWNDYARIGKQVHGTRFVAFKVPLKEVKKVNNQSQNAELNPKFKTSLVHRQQIKGVKCLKNNSKLFL